MPIIGSVSSGRSFNRSGPVVVPGSQTFSVAGSYTFIVPYYLTMIVEIWGGGGSGGEAYNGNTISQGGQGGSYKRYIIAAGQLAINSIQDVVVGAGGAAVQSNGGAGLAGGYSTFGNAIWASGGYGGRGQFALLTNPISYTPTVSHSWTLDYEETGGAGGYGAVGSNATYAGGGGGGGQNTGGVFRAGGTSTYGGNGGRGYGTWGVYPETDGVSPGGGGGGGVYVGLTGKGGAGQVKISWS